MASDDNLSGDESSGDESSGDESSGDGPSGDGQLARIIAQYIEMVESGTEPNRGDFLAAHPEFADELRSFFADLDLLGGGGDKLPPGSEDITLGPSSGQESPSGPKVGASVRYFGDYELLEEIARGGMGVVYRARQVSLNRIVALKMILTGQLASEDDVQRFRSEAEAAANLDHPGIVPIFEVGEHDGHQYFSMGLVEGSSLAERLEDGPLAPPRATVLMEKVAQAVEYAHERGVIHRDLKPANILLDASGEPRITDFGLAKRVEGGSELTATGQILGTPSYMPPEQATGRAGSVTMAADVYALGAVLYALTTGRPPFQASSPMDTLLQVLEREPVAPRLLNAKISRDLETVTLKCLEKDPRRRYVSAAALADDLKRLLHNEPVHARPVGSSTRLWRWCRRQPMVAGLLAAVILAVVSGSLVSVLFALEADRRAEEASKNAREAGRQRTAARQERQAALEYARTAERNLYIAHMGLIRSSWRERELGRVRNLLARYRPSHTAPLVAVTTDATDLRGFEWYYFQALCEADLLTIHRPDEQFRCLSLSPDGSRIVIGADNAHSGSANESDQLLVIDAASGETLLELEHEGSVSRVATSYRQLASAGDAGQVFVWDMDDGELRDSIDAHPGTDITALAFSPDNSLLMSADAEGTVKEWHAIEGALRRTFRAHPTTVTCIVFASDGSQFCTGSYAGDDNASWLGPHGVSLEDTVKLWDVSSGEVIHGMRHPGGVADASFSSGNLLASAGGDGAVRVWNTRTGIQAFSLEGHEGIVSSVAFDRDGQHLISGGYDRTVRVWDVASETLRFTLRGHELAVTGVDFDDRIARIVSAGADGTVRVWDAGTNPEVTQLDHGGIFAISNARFSPDSRRLVTCGDGIKLWDMETREPALTLAMDPPLRSAIQGMAFSVGGELLAAMNQVGDVVLFSTHTGAVVKEFPSVAPGFLIRPPTMFFSKDSRRLFIASAEAYWLDFATSEIQMVNDTIDGRPVADREGDRLAVLTGRSLVDWWSISGESTGRLDSGWPAVHAAFSPDGTKLALVGQGGGAAWDLATGRRCFTFGTGSPILEAVFSPDGQRIATTQGDSVMLWDTESGEVVLELDAFPQSTSNLTFSPDQGYLAATGIDDQRAAVKVWSAPGMPDQEAGPAADDVENELRLIHELNTGDSG